MNTASILTSWLAVLYIPLPTSILYLPQTSKQQTPYRFKAIHKIWKLKIDEEIENLTEGRIIKVRQQKLKQTIRQWQEINEDSQSITDPSSRAMELFRNINSDAVIHPWEQGGLDRGYSCIAALLSVNYDLRMLVEKKYSFACGIARPMVLFNFDLDTLLLSGKDMHIASYYIGFFRSLINGLDGGRRKDWKKVKFLAIEVPTRYFTGVGPETGHDINFYGFIGIILCHFTDLKELTIFDSCVGDLLETYKTLKDTITVIAALLNLYTTVSSNIELRKIPAFARRVELDTGAPFKVPGVESLFIKSIIGPGWWRDLEDAHQDYLKRRMKGRAEAYLPKLDEINAKESNMSLDIHPY
ncbi:hypothetical protein BPAE_0024g00090 [Botrytis paeoniae]|uniref:Uncharacterized protein n=1 Tax=Botrytis paeoniae TaxID=278948 RepID=A0A4Z1FV23_9HELO|nr:hypothetical protein BPAE_0024g00090 [Botrytis paeoniae]